MVAISCARGGSRQIFGKIFFLRKSDELLEQAAQGSGGVTVSEGFQEKGRCSTEGHRIKES